MMIKTRVWICLLVGLFLVGLALALAPGAGPDRRNLVRRRFGAARQPSPGPELFCRKSIRNQHHHRAGGRIAVTQSDCPGGDCMQTGWQDGGRPIVCLPHRLVIQFTGTAGPDAISG